jgi:hypothetical protein
VPTTEETLTLSEAVQMLPDTPKVHTWKNDGLGVFPGYLPKGDVIYLIQRYGARRAKAAAERLSHGLVIEWPGVKLFVQTRSEP